MKAFRGIGVLVGRLRARSTPETLPVDPFGSAEEPTKDDEVKDFKFSHFIKNVLG